MDDELVEVAVPDHKVGNAQLIRGETVILTGYLLPIAGTHFLEYSLLVVTVVSVGHIGTTELAAASIASMTSNVSLTAPSFLPKTQPELTLLLRRDAGCGAEYHSRILHSCEYLTGVDMLSMRS